MALTSNNPTVFPNGIKAIVVDDSGNPSSFTQQPAIVDLTDSTGFSGTHNDTLAATTVPADLTGGEAPTEAEFNALLAVIRVMAQNTSDNAQKTLELLAALRAAGVIAT